jgi:PilZ domain
MEIVFESQFGTLMEGISGQFGTTPLGIFLFLIALATLPAALALIYRSQRRRALRERIARSEEIIRKKSEALGLTPAEKKLVIRLADTAEDPGTGYLVLFDEPYYTRAAENLAQLDDELRASSTAALRVRLGFKSERPGKPHSTAMIPEGSTLLLRPDKRSGIFKAKLLGIRPDGFEIGLEGSNLLAPGDSAVFQYQNSQGTFLFKSYCLKREGKRLLMRHQEKFRQLQKRAYFRSPWTGTLQTGRFEEEERFPSRFVDLGGGGASIQNPGNRFAEGDFLELSFRLPGQPEVQNLRGRVIRSSQGGKRLHLIFEGVQENQRDRILGSLFKSTANTE